MSHPRDEAEVRVLVLGGLDPTGGAGLLRDVLTARARGARPLAVGTAFTLQGSTGVVKVEPRAAEALRDAVIDALRSKVGAVAAVKVGLVPDGAHARAVVAALDEAGFRGPLVVDPVLVSSSGHELHQGPLDGLNELLARATLVTPNAPEAALLTGAPRVGTLAEALAAARSLCGRGVANVLVKGGHLDDPGASTDLLVSAEASRTFSAHRVSGPSPRGTGCALATALAVELGRGRPLPEAILAAKHWLAAQIAAAKPALGVWHLP